ncbi:MAG: hypothetical protein V1754_08875, partial [Pseudomonadota bacterium]
MRIMNKTCLVFAMVFAVGCGDGDGEEDLTVVDSTVSAATVSELDEQLDGFNVGASLMGALSETLDSDELLLLMEGRQRGALAGPGDPCQERDLTKNPIKVDFTPCEYAEGMVLLERVAMGKWLVTFQNAFKYRGVDIDG